MRHTGTLELETGRLLLRRLLPQLFLPQQFLYFLPLPQGQASFLPTLFSFLTLQDSLYAF